MQDRVFGVKGLSASNASCLENYSAATELTSERVALIRRELFEASSTHLAAILASSRAGGRDYYLSEEFRNQRSAALASDPAVFLSEALERGCVATSLTGRLRQSALADPNDFQTWQLCEWTVRTYSPITFELDTASVDRVLRCWTLAAEDIGASNLFSSIWPYWREKAVAPKSVESKPDQKTMLEGLIGRLEQAELQTREAKGRGGYFKYEHYDLLRQLRDATGLRSASPALARNASELAEKSRRRQILFVSRIEEWHPLLAELLDTSLAKQEALVEWHSYQAVDKLDRQARGRIVHDVVDLWINRKKYCTERLDELSELGRNGKTVGSAEFSFDPKLSALVSNLVSKRFETDDVRMASILAQVDNWRALATLKLLASVEWTLSNGPAPQTTLALHALMQKKDVWSSWGGLKGFPARIAELLSKYEQTGIAAQIDSKSNTERRTTVLGQTPDAAALEHGGQGFFQRLFGSIFSANPAETPRTYVQAAPSAHVSFVYERLAGADANLKATTDGRRSKARAEEFYKELERCKVDLHELWIELHVASYPLDGKAAPTTKWLDLACGLIDAHGVSKFEDLTRNVLSIINPMPDGRFLGLNTVRGLIFLTSQLGYGTLAPVLTEFAMKKCYVTVPGWGIKSEKLGNACLWALSNMPDGAGVPYLARILARVKYPKIRAKIDAALNEAAERAGVTRDALDELTVPTHDLDTNGQVAFDLNGGQAIVALSGNKDVDIRWLSPEGKSLKAPRAVMKEDKETIKAAKALAKEIEADLATQIIRLQRLFLDDRSWPVDEWRARYLEHPLLRLAVQRLVWWVDKDGERNSAMAVDGGLTDIAGNPVDAGAAVIRLWHPIEDSVDAVLQWRDRIEALQIVQPFAQAWREIYRLTDAERTTGSYTNRWAGHILKQHQAMTLARLNKWTVTHRMWVDAPNDAPWHVVLPAHGLVADYWVQGAGGEDPETLDSQAYVYVSTDRVTFHRIADHHSGKDSAYGPDRSVAVPLEEIAPVVFSEIMRHCDLFTGVASIASDPQWLDRGGDAPHPNQWRRDAAEYWNRTSFAELTGSGKVRREMLERIIPRLAIGKQCSFDDQALIVEGRRHSYRIHMGSAAVQIARTSQHVCIVPSGGTDKGAAAVWLPFEGDRTLSIILSKAILLAADDKITDPVILRQL